MDTAAPDARGSSAPGRQRSPGGDPRLFCFASMALAVRGQSLVLPAHAEGADPENLFATMRKEFGISTKVGSYLVDVEGLSSLSDFVHRLTSDGEIGTFVAAIEGLSRPGLETSRLRKAWRAARAAAATADKKRKTGEDEDLDLLLPAPELSDIKTAFYGRYKLRFPVKTEPCDKLVSRLAREMSRRIPCRPPQRNGGACVAAGASLASFPCSKYGAWSIS